MRSIPFCELELHGSLIGDALLSPHARDVLETCVALGRSLGMTAVAVGVETQNGWDLLSRLGVDAVQGYLVAHPLPDEAIPHWVGFWNAGDR